MALGDIHQPAVFVVVGLSTVKLGVSYCSNSLIISTRCKQHRGETALPLIFPELNSYGLLYF